MPIQERERKPTIVHKTISNDELTRRGSLDVCLNPVVSLNKKAPRQRRASLFFASMHYVRKFSTSFTKLNNADIVSPFAQVLAKLNSIKCHLEESMPTQTEKVRRHTVAPGQMQAHAEQLKGEEMPKTSLDPIMANKINANREVLEDVVWCLEQLQGMHTYSPVSEMTRKEFKKVMLERSSSSESEFSSQIIEILNQTYDNDETDGSASSYSAKSSRCVSRSSRNSSLSTIDEKQKLANHQGVSIAEEKVVGGDVLPLIDGDIPDVTNADLSRLNIIPTKLVTQELMDLLHNHNKWGMDIFRLSELTNDQPLTVLAYTIFKSRGLLNLLRIDEKVFIRFFLLLERSYRNDVPYHNSRHAADVMQSTHVLLQSKTLNNVFSPLEILSSIFAAAIHDVDHPGVTNQYLINTGSDLALLYNDVSVLENHHLSTAFKLLRQEGCDIFVNLTKDDWQKLRKLVIDIVLATDMSKHMTLLSQMRTMMETQLVNNNNAAGYLYLDNYNNKSLVLQNMVHCADLSNPTKPLVIFSRWTTLILEEFFRQGDEERKQSLNISPNCDRHSVLVDESQLGFIDYIVRPVWETWADLVHPDVQEMLDVLKENRKHHQSKAVQASLKITSGSKLSNLKKENET